MCGIVGYIGSQEAAPSSCTGCGSWNTAAMTRPGWPSSTTTARSRCVARRANWSTWQTLLGQEPVPGAVGVGHTRWATHGPPSQRNAHPHSSPDGDLVVVQNGIVENFLELRQRPAGAQGYDFRSDTDTEVIVHLIHRHYHNGCAGDLAAAVRTRAARSARPQRHRRALPSASRIC